MNNAGSPRIYAMRHCAQLAACRSNEEDDLIRAREVNFAHVARKLARAASRSLQPWRNERGTTVIVALLQMRLCLEMYVHICAADIFICIPA